MAQRAFATIGAGWTGALLYNNADLVKELGSRFLSSASGPAGSASADPALLALTAQLAQLTQLVALQSHAGGRVPEKAWLLAGAGALALGWGTSSSWSDWWYVSRRQFATGIKTLGTAVGALGGALQRVKAALQEQIGVVQSTLDAHTTRLDDVMSSQEALASELAGAREDIGALTGAVEVLSSKQDVNTRGVLYLCSAVSSVSKDQGKAPQLEELNAALQAPTSTCKKPALAGVEAELANIAALARTAHGM
jgi:hypothetical protein